MIFQSLAEGNITRLSALFHRVPGVVGPVRSARFVTVYLAQRLSAEVMCSGGSSSTLARLTAAKVPTLVNDYDHGRHFYRWSGRAAPHNVYTSQNQMVAAAPDQRPAAPLNRPASFRHLGRYGSSPDDRCPRAPNQLHLQRRRLRRRDRGHPAHRCDLRVGEAVLAGRSPRAAVPRPARRRSTAWPVRITTLAAGGGGRCMPPNLQPRQWSTSGATGPITLSDATGTPVGMPRGLLWVSLAP